MKNGETCLRYLLEPIADHLSDRDTTEIVVQRPGEIGIERDGCWLWREVPEFDYERLDAIGVLAGSLLSKRFDPANPICLTTLPDGQRCTVIRPPVTPTGTISLTIRIPSQLVHTVRDDDFSALMQAATNEPAHTSNADTELLRLYRACDWPAFFTAAVKAHKTIVATGAVGSGKTSVLRRLMQDIPSDERVITLEDTPEFGDLPIRNRVSLFYGAAGVSAEDAVETSLRMRPTRVAMQELRGSEAFAYLRLLAAGHPGGLTTWHAEEGDPWTPLALMTKTSVAGRNIPDDKLDVILRGLIDIVAYCRRDDSGFSVPSVYYRAAAEIDG
jgi:type IV secretion system protein VirB11